MYIDDAYFFPHLLTNVPSSFIILLLLRKYNNALVIRDQQ